MIGVDGIGFKLIQALGLNKDRREDSLSRSGCRRHRCRYSTYDRRNASSPSGEQAIN
jgi:hypothetical protein